MEKLNLIGFYTLLSGEGCGSRYYPHFLLNCHLNFPHTMDHSLQHTQIVIIQSTFEKIKFPSNTTKDSSKYYAIKDKDRLSNCSWWNILKKQSQIQCATLEWILGQGKKFYEKIIESNGKFWILTVRYLYKCQIPWIP